MSDIIDAIRKAVKSQIKPDLLLGKVKSFDSSNWTVDVDLNNGATVEEVTVRSVLNSEDTGLFIKPKVGSRVLCGMVDGKLENLTILVFSEIENIEIMPGQKMKLRGDDYGGLVKLQELKDNLDELKQYCSSLKSAISNGMTAIGAGSAASGPTGKTAFETEMSSASINFGDMENKNISHG